MDDEPLYLFQGKTKTYVVPEAIWKRAIDKSWKSHKDPRHWKKREEFKNRFLSALFEPKGDL